MITHTQFPAPMFPNKHGFFESLPRELRDKVYTELRKEVELYKNALRLRISIPVVALRLISRQAKLEYDEISSRAEHMSRLVIIEDWGIDRSADLRVWTNQYRPTLAARIANITAELAFCFGARSCEEHAPEARVYWYATDINELLRDMPNLRSIWATTTVRHAKCFSEILKSMEYIIALPCIVELVIMLSDHQVGNTDDRKTLAIWTKQDGLVKDHEAVNQLS